MNKIVSAVGLATLLFDRVIVAWVIKNDDYYYLNLIITDRILLELIKIFILNKCCSVIYGYADKSVSF
jgi:hypothetical protein